MSLNKSASIVGLPLVGLALFTIGTTLLHAEDVIVTGCVGSSPNACPPSCPDSLGTAQRHVSASVAVPAGAARSETLFGITTNATWAVTPTLGTSAGVYKVYVSQGTTYNCPTDIHVKLVATSGCALADTNYVAQSEIDTTAFQRGASLNSWTPVAVITNSSTKPTLTFSWASGGCSRWYMDEVRFENIAAATPEPTRIIAIHYGNPITISGTGPASRPFALVSSTDAARPLSQWSPEQTNTACTGGFTFTVTPRSADAIFFRVLSQ